MQSATPHTHIINGATYYVPAPPSAAGDLRAIYGANRQKMADLDSSSTRGPGSFICGYIGLLALPVVCFALGGGLRDLGANHMGVALQVGSMLGGVAVGISYPISVLLLADSTDRRYEKLMNENAGILETLTKLAIPSGAPPAYNPGAFPQAV
jgi:hypothetical protein